jgi:hypothetical protein
MAAENFRTETTPRNDARSKNTDLKKFKARMSQTQAIGKIRCAVSTTFRVRAFWKRRPKKCRRIRATGKKKIASLPPVAYLGHDGNGRSAGSNNTLYLLARFVF